MIYKVELLKDLPSIKKGKVVYVTDSRKHEIINGKLESLTSDAKELLRYISESSWISTEESDVKDPRPHLSESEIVKELNGELVNIKEFPKYGWKVEKDENDCYKCTCKCGSTDISYTGILGVESVECRNCNDGFQDMTGMIRTSNSTATYINTEDYQHDDGRVWMNYKYLYDKVNETEKE